MNRFFPFCARLPALLALAAAAVVWSGCRTGTGAGAAAVYPRATGHLERVVLCKPREGQGTNLAQKFTPLVLQEILPADPPDSGRDAWGALPGEEAAGRMVYAREQTVALPGGGQRTQVTYLWFYPPARRGRSALPCQGVRLTLNAAGQPVIWEMLAATNGQREIYVAGSIEHGAALRYRQRLPGRRHFAEPEDPTVVVPLVLEDSAELFGPMVFLAAASRSPHAVLCRCMPAPARVIAGMAYYEIKPWPEDWRRRIRRRPDAGAIRALLEDFERRPAVSRLRLPEAF